VIIALIAGKTWISSNNRPAKTIIITLISSIVIYAVLYFTSPPILKAINVNEKLWAYANYALRAYCLGSSLVALSLSLCTCLLGYAQKKQFFLCRIIALLLPLLFAYLMVIQLHFGIIGGFLSFAASELVVTIIVIILLQRFKKSKCNNELCA
jgi:Na+-driven multidrug efflux pump